MNIDKRMAEILSRQEAAANAKREQDRKTAEAADIAARRRTEVEVLWTEKSASLDKAILRLNAAMAGNDVQLVRGWTDNSGPAGQLELVEIKFSNDNEYRSLKCLMVHVDSRGLMHIRMGTANHMPAKHYSFPMEDADDDRWMETLLDFIDLNILKTP